MDVERLTVNALRAATDYETDLQIIVEGDDEKQYEIVRIIRREDPLVPPRSRLILQIKEI